jgi:hypothetical protein
MATPSRASTLFDQIIKSDDPAAVIEGMVTSQEPENEFLEFKTCGQERDNRKNWCVALSGFANTEGGVVIWGIATDKVLVPPSTVKVDVASAAKPLLDPVGFVVWLQRQFLQTTVDLVQGVEMRAVTKQDGAGYVVCFIPEGKHRPYRDVSDNQYWQRVQDSFVAISHSMLRAMFYPVISPDLRLETSWGSETEITFSVTNVGTASAEALHTAYKLNPRNGYLQYRSYYSTSHAYIHSGQSVAILCLDTSQAKRFWMVELNFAFYSRNQVPQCWRVVLPYDYKGAREGSNGFVITPIEPNQITTFTQKLAWSGDS